MAEKRDKIGQILPCRLDAIFLSESRNLEKLLLHPSDLNYKVNIFYFNIFLSKFHFSCKRGEEGGFEVEGDKTKFATLQRQRKQLYDEIRDSKCRAQNSLRRNLLSPTCEAGGSSAEKLLDHCSLVGSSIGERSSPCSTPTPPPYNRSRLTSSPIPGSNQVKFISKRLISATKIFKIFSNGVLVL